MKFGAFFARDPAGGVPALFAGRRVSYSFNTRVAIRKACDLLGLRPGDEVLAPAYNCGSELDPLLHAGVKVVLYPVDRLAQIDPAMVERSITTDTKAIYVTHYFGFLQPALADLRSLCDAYGLWLIEDCALSLLSGIAPVDGRAGDVSVFCFYKFFPVVAGGALAINSDRIFGRADFDTEAPSRFVTKRALRAGLSLILGARGASATLDRLRHIKKRASTGSLVGVEPVQVQSTLPDMPAHYYFDPRLQDTRISRLAACQIRSFNVAAAISARRENYQTFLSGLDEIQSVKPLFPHLTEEACPLSMPVLVENRDALVRALVACGIAATPWWSGYSRRLDFSRVPDACYLKDHVLSLPCHQFMGPVEVHHITTELHRLISLG
jgi:dTDP-4-amino-4,6-dideoxygalactose transaminase